MCATQRTRSRLKRATHRSRCRRRRGAAFASRSSLRSRCPDCRHGARDARRRRHRARGDVLRRLDRQRRMCSRYSRTLFRQCATATPITRRAMPAMQYAASLHRPLRSRAPCSRRAHSRRARARRRSFAPPRRRSRRHRRAAAALERDRNTSRAPSPSSPVARASSAPTSRWRSRATRDARE